MFVGGLNVDWTVQKMFKPINHFCVQQRNLKLSKGSQSDQHPFKTILKFRDTKISLEVSSKKDLDYELLETLKPRFCSVNWRVTSELECTENVEISEPLLLAEKLNQKGYNVLLNLPGKQFSKDQVLRILNTAKFMGVRAIFAIQGGRHQSYLFAQHFVLVH